MRTFIDRFAYGVVFARICAFARLDLAGKGACGRAAPRGKAIGASAD